MVKIHRSAQSGRGGSVINGTTPRSPRKAFVAKYDGSCAGCGQAILKGRLMSLVSGRPIHHGGQCRSLAKKAINPRE